MSQEPAPVRVALVYALTDEVRPLVKEASLGPKIIHKQARIQLGTLRGVEVAFCRTGIGIANAHEGAERLLELAKPEVILSLGCAGAAHPDLETGDVVLPSEIRSETPTDRFATSEAERIDLERLLREEQIPYSVGTVMTLWKIAGRTAKEESGAKGAACVDMETAAVAAIAEKAGVPLVSLRVIFDTIEEEFPSDEPFDEDHPLLYLMKHPKFLAKIPRYAKSGALCRNRLYLAAGRFIAGRIRAPRPSTSKAL